MTAAVIALVLLGSSTGVIALRSRRAPTATPAAAPAGSSEIEDGIVAEEPPAAEREGPTGSERRGKERRRNRSGRKAGSSYGGSYGFGGGTGSPGGSGGGGGYAPPSSAEPPASGSGGSSAGSGAGGGGGGSNDSSTKPPPPPPPNEQPATLALHYLWDDDGRYFFTADDALADDRSDAYRYRDVIAAVWAAPGRGLIPLCYPDRCKGYVSGEPPKKGAYKTLYVYNGAHGRFFTTDPSTAPSGTDAVLYGYAR